MWVKLDENVPVQLKRLFIESGHEADTVLDERMGGATDVEIASACASEGRVLVTQDLDFADIRAYPPPEYPGIIVFRMANQGRDELLQVTAALIETLTRSSPRGQLWIVEETRVRIRE